jgi:hypothetical protein
MDAAYILVLVAFLGPDQQMTGMATAEFSGEAACVTAGRAASEVGGTTIFYLPSSSSGVIGPRIKWRCSPKEDQQ